MSVMEQITETQEAQELLALWNSAVEESEFQQALKRDARAAIAERFGIEVPADVELRVEPDRPGVVRVVQPGDAAKGALSEADLEVVAGGFTLIELLVVMERGDGYLTSK